MVDPGKRFLAGFSTCPAGLAFSGRNRTQLRIRGIVGSVPTINTTLGACEGLDVVWLH